VITRANGGTTPLSATQDDDLDLLEAKDVARLFKVKESWVRSATRSRARAPMPHVMVGRYVRFQEAAVRAWLETRKKGYPVKRSH
jgi:predicted DNA-binding transcriptional regulator AlpA